MEREICLKSGGMVLAALRCGGVDAHAFDPRDQGIDRLIAERFDRVFIALHGRFGEDGTVQGALEYLGIPYTGSGVMASALAMDKWRTKLVWQAAGVSTAPYELLSPQSDWTGVPARLGLPLMVKPAREGSSIGMSKVTTTEKLQAAFDLAARYDDIVIAERFIEGMELTAGILGDGVAADQARRRACSATTKRKYFADDTHYICPADSRNHRARIQQQALDIPPAWMPGETGRPHAVEDVRPPAFLEVNTVPGMTDHSLVPMAARARGLSFEELVLRILESAHVG
jgi:D-alanine-D-alanine ligase